MCHQVKHSGNPSHLQAIFDSSQVWVTSNISSSSFRCRQVCASSPLQPIFSLAESRERKGLAEPLSTAVPNTGSPPAPLFHAATAGERELGARSSFGHLSAARLTAMPPSRDAASGCTLACRQRVPERERASRLTGE